MAGHEDEEVRAARQIVPHGSVPAGHGRGGVLEVVAIARSSMRSMDGTPAEDE